MSKQKLELTWIGKAKRPRLEPWILLEDAEKSYHAKYRRFRVGPNLLAPSWVFAQIENNHAV
ncbi:MULTISPECIES: hypothetical protein [Methylomicrobium]|uniref:Uncharacterized protein n=1 Tax=Methylomicrobium album BG8 TaxID=686340 RepID=H8GQQ7_METAL|nr:MULTISPECIES: hypothetical protein [Methylomicrobium]EIC31042.1 hypothetical protein Metal_3382 [Methylomicrobium album BG8]